MVYFPEPTYTIAYLFRRLLIPIDGSEQSLKALKLAVDFALRYGSKITALYIAYEGQNELYIEDIKRKILEVSQREGVDIECKIRYFNPMKSSIVKEIVRESIDGPYDAVIIGSQGVGGLGGEIVMGEAAIHAVIFIPKTIVIVR
ncbi:MAG: universal stress protein [Candidatus Methanomethylicia archaeon]